MLGFSSRNYMLRFRLAIRQRLFYISCGAFLKKVNVVKNSKRVC